MESEAGSTLQLFRETSIPPGALEIILENVNDSLCFLGVCA